MSRIRPTLTWLRLLRVRITISRNILLPDRSVDGYRIESVEWSDRVGASKVTISKDGKFATLTFNEALLSQRAAPNAPPALDQMPQSMPAMLPSGPMPAPGRFKQKPGAPAPTHRSCRRCGSSRSCGISGKGNRSWRWGASERLFPNDPSITAFSKSLRQKPLSPMRRTGLVALVWRSRLRSAVNNRSPESLTCSRCLWWDACSVQVARSPAGFARPAL